MEIIRFVKLFLIVLLGSLVLIGADYIDPPIARERVPIDAVLVLDVSLSMITADPNRIANDAMNMFVNYLDPHTDRVGIVAYAGHITESRPLISLDDSTQVAYIQNLIHGLEYASWTDHPLGLMEAMEILQASDHTRQGVIVFLTDGNLNINPQSPRDHHIAQVDKDNIIAQAVAQGITIYSIGLNFDGGLDARYTTIVATSTGGIAFETAHPQDLPGIMEDIFALMEYNLVKTVRESEPEPTPEPVYVTAPTEAVLVEAYVAEEAARNFLWMILPVVIVALIPIKLMRPKRIFTGRLYMAAEDKYINLIEYGRHFSLHKKISLTPCNTAPSHMPRVMLRVKDAIVLKDFVPQDTSKPIPMQLGAEVVIRLDGEDKDITLQYLM